MPSTGAAAQAGTPTTSLDAFTAGLDRHVVRDTSVGVADGSTVSSVPLAEGGTLAFSPAVTKASEGDDQPLPPFAAGSTGDAFEAGASSVTVALDGDAFGLEVFTGSVSTPTYDPDGVGLIGLFFGCFDGRTTLTVTSSDPNLLRSRKSWTHPNRRLWRFSESAC